MFSADVNESGGRPPGVPKGLISAKRLKVPMSDFIEDLTEYLAQEHHEAIFQACTEMPQAKVGEVYPITQEALGIRLDEWVPDNCTLFT